MEYQGLKVSYNGKVNAVFYPPDWDIEYAIGEMLLDVYEADTDKKEQAIREQLLYNLLRLYI